MTNRKNFDTFKGKFLLEPDLKKALNQSILVQNFFSSTYPLTMLVGQLFRKYFQHPERTFKHFCTEISSM